MTALHFAAAADDDEMMRILITVGASTSIRDNQGFDFFDHDFSNPSVPLPSLHDAVNNQNVPLIRFLIGSGHDVDARGPHGRTALMCAVFSSPEHGCTPKSTLIAKILLAHGANVDAQDDNGMTALHFAAAADGDEMMRILITVGASTSIRDSQGFDFFDHAFSNPSVLQHQRLPPPSS